MGPADRGTKSPARPFVLAFWGLLIVWAAMPVLLTGQVAQDAVPYVVAGEFVTIDPHSVYAARAGDLYALDPAFAARSCAVSPAGTDCTSLNVAYVSTPLALPIAYAVARLGPDEGVFALRLVAGLCLVGGMLVLRDRLAGRGARADAPLLATVVLLTPFAMVPLALGQTSPLLFLSAALGLSDRGRRWFLPVASGVFVLAVVLKAWPVVLVVILLGQRRWAFIAWSAGWGALLAVLSLPFSPVAVMGDFVRASSALSANVAANPFNGSLDALARAVWPPLTEGSGAAVLWGLRLGLVTGLWVWGGRRAGSDSQWALGHLSLLLLVPLVWWHYLWVAVAAVGVCLAERPPRRTVPDVALLPLVALVAAPLSLPRNDGAWPVPQALFLLVSAVLVACLCRPEPLVLHLPWRRAVLDTPDVGTYEPGPTPGP